MTSRLWLPVLFAAVWFGSVTGCGNGLLGPPVGHREVGVDGQTFTLDELKAVADDADLTDEEKRERFRQMGIEDADLIDALLSL